MRNDATLSFAVSGILTAATIVLLGVATSVARESIVHNFSVMPNGANPQSNLIADSAGNLYGTTYDGGYGVVFELTPLPGGKWKQSTVHTFAGNPASGADGAYPAAGLTFDSSGNLYGTTSEGGMYGQGIVFKLSPSAGGKWKEIIIHVFTGYPSDGAAPMADLVFDSAGNLYGTTEYGGSGDGCGDQYDTVTCGTVFELSPSEGGWTQNILYNFQGGTDGCAPVAPVILDKHGNVYGTTQLGGVAEQPCYYGGGTVFEVSRGSGGAWTESVLYAFTGGADGGSPSGGMIFNGAGDLYGTTSFGGPSTAGVVFDLRPAKGGTWTEDVLYGFSGGSDGALPESNLTFDSFGNLYGTTEAGGSSTNCSGSGCGTIFQLSPHAGRWKESVLYSFTNGSDGNRPLAGVLVGAAGNLYTTASIGANAGCNYYSTGCGAVVKVKPSSGGGWAGEVVYDFPSPHDGSSPYSNLISDAAGNLYGTTESGGAYQLGTVFELVPTSNGNWKTRVLYSFVGNATDGANPTGGVIFDKNGNLYGTTQNGGNICGTDFTCGTVFELTPSLNGGWTENVIFAFSGDDGFRPVAGLVIDGQGALYGTTELGGNGGNVFRLIHSHDHGWQENVLINFDQAYPQSALVLDEEGNLYGTTLGTVFKLTRSKRWALTTLHSFSGNGGFDLTGSLIFDKEGALYGTAREGGIYSAGAVFKLTPESSGVWTETVLHNFVGVNGDGAIPASNLIFDNLGNLYGTTTIGGIDGGGCGGLGCGTAFELVSFAGDKWKERVLHRFTGGLDGGQPYAGFILDSGNLYTTTSAGGSAGQGTVIEIRP
jgi:uncharacterized repeat protein (TIGR03803 family)